MKRTAAAALVLLGSWPALSQSGTLYTSAELSHALGTYGRNLRGMWNADFVGRLQGQEALVASRMRLELPLTGPKGYPFEYYADPSTGVITIPIASVQFLDDVGIAYAWYEERGCDIDAIGDYVGMLRFANGASIGSPRAALGLPPTALDDSYVNDVSGKLLKSAVYFLMAHEFAHVFYRDAPYTHVPAATARAHEAAADAFGLEMMRRIRVVPAGMVTLFIASSRLESTPGDFATAAEYDEHLRREATHPLSAARLVAIARSIREHAPEFAAGQDSPETWLPRIRQIADQVESVGQSLDDRALRATEARHSKYMTRDQLARACAPGR